MFILAILGILFVCWMLWTLFLHSLNWPIWPGCKPIDYQAEVAERTECYKQTGKTDYETFVAWKAEQRSK